MSSERLAIAAEVLHPKCRLTRLALCLAPMFAVSSPISAHTTWNVTNCSDGNPPPSGSLRQIIHDNVQGGDTVDLAACSAISLTQGVITIAQGDLMLLGAGPSSTVLDGIFNSDRILKHTGGGTLSLSQMSVEFAYLSSATSTVNGGCIYSNGTLELSNVVVVGCKAKATGASNRANGGALFANSVSLVESVVSDSKAYSTVNAGYSAGGGIWASNDLTMSNSSVSHNTALKGAGIYSLGLGNTSIVQSTISGNVATEFVVNSRGTVGGGIAILAPSPNNSTIVISNSTISGNSSENEDGGASISSVASLTIFNSTIAFNRAGSYSNRAAGLTVFGSSGNVQLESSVLSNNVNSLQDLGSDFAVTGMTVSGANNIIYASSATVTGIAVSKCPLLGPLRDNGGATSTHALLSTSPALATGNNSQNLAYDQRGFGYARTSRGDLGVIFTDMGAYEVQRADVVFDASFDGCP